MKTFTTVAEFHLLLMHWRGPWLCLEIASPYLFSTVEFLSDLPLREKLLGSLHLDGVDSDLPYLSFCSAPSPIPKWSPSHCSVCLKISSQKNIRHWKIFTSKTSVHYKSRSTSRKSTGRNRSTSRKFNGRKATSRNRSTSRKSNGRMATSRKEGCSWDHHERLLHYGLMSSLIIPSETSLFQ